MEKKGLLVLETLFGHIVHLFTVFNEISTELMSLFPTEDSSNCGLQLVLPVICFYCYVSNFPLMLISSQIEVLV